MIAMDSGFLKEYESREIEAFQRNPDVSQRIGNLKQPLFHLTGPCSSIWSQIALSGTLIFPIHPLSQQVFEKGWKISATQIPSLVQFAKETKKIQFVLTAKPTAYDRFNYLEPILRELLPPIYTQDGRKNPKLQEINEQCNDEIRALIRISPHWRYLSSTVGGSHIIDDYINSYAALRYFGFNEIADTFIEHFLVDPQFSTDYLITAYDLLVDPIIDPFKACPSYCLEKFRKGSELHLTGKIQPVFPEVGSFLVKRCTHYPESLDTCKQLIGVYEENDLYNVYSALNHAVIDRNESIVFEKKEAMDEILDNVWEDKTIERGATAIRTGIDITCGTVGYCLAGPEGLLTSLGLRVIDGGNYIGQFSELISRKIAYPYMSTIYDFKKKYSIK